MENTEEAIIHDDGSITISYYFGKKVVIPAYIMDEIYYAGLYDNTALDRLQKRKRR